MTSGILAPAISVLVAAGCVDPTRVGMKTGRGGRCRGTRSRRTWSRPCAPRRKSRSFGEQIGDRGAEKLARRFGGGRGAETEPE